MCSTLADKGTPMDLVKVDRSNTHVYLNLIQAYEAEFSKITNKEPNIDGIYELDTILGDEVHGFILVDNAVPIGICAIKMSSRIEVCEFYVIPSRRRKGIGEIFAKMIWRKFPGEWEVKQISGADDARLFWRSAISEYTSGVFAEDVYNDPYWGTVTRQVFVSINQ
jgi:predicted acetyltransferase